MNRFIYAEHLVNDKSCVTRIDDIVDDSDKWSANHEIVKTMCGILAFSKFEDKKGNLHFLSRANLIYIAIRKVDD